MSGLTMAERVEEALARGRSYGAKPVAILLFDHNRATLVGPLQFARFNDIPVLVTDTGDEHILGELASGRALRTYL